MNVPALVGGHAKGRPPVYGVAAWEAAYVALGAGPRPRAELVALMQEASGIAHDSARDLLRRAVKLGHLRVVERDEAGRPTLARAE